MLELYRAIWKISGRRQIVLILLSLAIAGLAAAPLKFQQEIVNLLTFGSFELSHLYLLCAGMMGVIVLSLALKWLMGYRSQILGEDIIRLIRKTLFNAANGTERSGGAIRVGALSTAISAEAEDLGKFAGGAFSEPVMQIGTLISVVGFVASTQPILGAIAFCMIFPQVVIVLYTQTKVNALLAERVRVLRAASDRFSAKDLKEVETSVLEDFDSIFGIRRSMFKWKLSTKFLLSIINGAGTVVVFLIGGAFVLKGQTDVGTVVAATLGLNRLHGPTAFLIAFYRQVSANRVKYELLRGLDLKDAKVTAAP